MPYINIIPIGITEIACFIRKIQKVLIEQNFDVDFEDYIDIQMRFISQSAWFSRSIDCQNLTDKKTFIFGDSTHTAVIRKILVKEMGINVVIAGTYCKYDKALFNKEVCYLCDEIIITDDHKVIL